MRKPILIAMLMVVAMVCMSTAAFALPTLITTETNKFKYTNYENWLGAGDTVYSNGRIDAGESLYINDKFEGIFTVTTISNVPETNVTWETDDGDDELTGYFKDTVTGIAGLTSNGWVYGTASTDYMTLGHTNPSAYSATMNIGGTTYNVTDTMFRFGLETGDVFEMNYQSTGNNWDPKAGDAIAKARDGDSYLKVTDGDMLEFYSYHNFFGTSTQLNAWFNLTENDTGYSFDPTVWGDTPHYWPWDSSWHNPLLSQMFMEGSLYTFDTEGWGYRSEDPMYGNAVPEPATMLLLGSGLLGLAGFSRRKFKK